MLVSFTQKETDMIGAVSSQVSHPLQKQFREAIHEMRRISFLLPDQRVVYRLLRHLDKALQSNTAAWVTSCEEPEIDLLILQAKIKQAKYLEIKQQLQREALARLWDFNVSNLN